MNNITCPVCEDLIPLVRDGVASPESCALVRAHTESCPRCRALLEGNEPPQTASVLPKVRSRLRLNLALMLSLGIFLGVCTVQLTESFLFVLMLPVIGALAYGVWGWRALWKAPLVLASSVFCVTALLHFTDGLPFELFAAAVQSLLAGAAADVGALIAGLLHFGLKKEKKDEKE